MNCGPGALRRGGQAPREGERLYCPTTWVEHSCHIAGGARPLGHLSLAPHLRCAPKSAPLLHGRMQFRHMRGSISGTQSPATLGAAIDSQPLDQLEKKIG